MKITRKDCRCYHLDTEVTDGLECKMRGGVIQDCCQGSIDISVPMWNKDSVTTEEQAQKNRSRK